MFLIITYQQDLTTNQLIDWLIAAAVPYFVLGEKDILEIIKIDIENEEYTVRTKKGLLELHKIEAVLIRKGELFIDNIFAVEDLFDEQIKSYFKDELQTVKIFLQFILMEKKCFNSFFTQRINKLIALHFAKEAGLLIPNTIITTEKESTLEFLANQNTITKPIYETLFISKDDVNIKNYTNVVKYDDLKGKDNSFFPSLLQTEIQKKYELRIFVIANTCYSMAIFSQQSAQTSVDFRNYNHQKPNRTVPYLLPKIIERKIRKFMNLCRLKTGSIDMAVDTQNNHIFFEVNPVGQFGMVSAPCNYALEQKIVDLLIKKQL